MKKIIVILMLVYLFGCSSTTNKPSLETIEKNPFKPTLFEKLNFSDAGNISLDKGISFHGVTNNELYFSQFQTTNNTIYSTIGVSTYNFKTKEIKKRKEIVGDYRIWDYILLDDGTAYYSKIEIQENELQPYKISIVKEKEEVEKVLYSGIQYTHMKSSTFSKMNEKVYFLLEEAIYEKDKPIQLVASLNEIQGDVAKRIWEQKATLDDRGMAIVGDEILTNTNPRYSDSITAFISQQRSKDNILKSKVYYFKDEEMNFVEFNEFVDVIIPLKDYILVQSEESSYAIDCKTNTKTVIQDLNTKCYSGVQIKGNDFIFTNEKFETYLGGFKENNLALKPIKEINEGKALRYFVNDSHIIGAGEDLSELEKNNSEIVYKGFAFAITDFK